MYYQFLNTDILHLIKNNALDLASIQKYQIDDKNAVILPNNFNIFSGILGFLNDDKNVFILNGFIGSGKSYFLNFMQNFLYSKVLVFKFNCYEATTLDDILLSFYTDFIDYHNKHKITLPKVSSQIFSDKINAYIKSCINPILIIIDSFENLNDKNKIDVINFVNYLAKFDKIKIFIGARNFDESFLSKDIKFSEEIMKIFDKGFLNELLAQNDINLNFFKSEEIYKYSKGHYIYISIIIIILSVLKISVDNLFDEFSRKNIVFFDFLVSKLLSLAPDSFLKPLWFLSVIRHGVSEKFLIDNNFISKEDIYYLEHKMILYREFDLLYLKDYIKNILLKTLEPVTKVKIHNFYIHIYESQLPKKPSERDLLISRDTMRKELEYHKKFIENSKLINPQVHKPQVKEVDFSYLSYSKTVGHDWTFPKNELEIKNVPALKIKNNNPSEKFELSKEELALLNSSSDASNEISYENIEPSFIEEAIEQKVLNPEISESDMGGSLDELIKQAQVLEKNFEFETAAVFYEKALLCIDDKMFEVKKPLLLTKLAICHKKLHNYDNALKYFEQVYGIYVAKEPSKANYILLSIAQIYSETYKYSLAKSTYEKILASKDEKSPSVLIRVYLDIADIEDNNANVEKALEYCKKALDELNKTYDKKLAGEVYFKYALLLDDGGRIDEAVEFYQKCINVSTDVIQNRFVSSAYSNLASIYSEKNNSDLAIKYFNLALESDKLLNNFEGLYFGNAKLANIYQSKKPEKALEYLLKALSAARRLNDNFYCASAYLDLGDFYYNRKIDAKALKAYFMARKLVMKQPNSENIRQVNTRINDIKVRMGETRFSQLINEFKKQ